MNDLDLRERMHREAAALPSATFTLDDVQRSGRRRRQVRRAGGALGLAAAVAAAVVLLAVLPGGGRNPSPEPVADDGLIDWDLGVYVGFDSDPGEVEAALAALPSVVETQYLADSRRIFPGDEDLVSATVVEPPHDPGMVVVRLADGADVGAVAGTLHTVAGHVGVVFSAELAGRRLSEYFDGITADAVAVLPGDPEIVQAAPGPEPAFATAPLGELVELLPIDGPADLDGPFLASFDAGGARPGDRRDRAQPLVHVGRLVTGESVVLYGSEAGELCTSVVEANGWGGGCRPLGFEEVYGVDSISGDGGGGTVLIFVPGDTSVATIAHGEVRQWQRPVAGYALFPFEGSEPRRLIVTAYDAGGVELGRWEGGFG